MNAAAERHLRTLADDELRALAARLRRQIAALRHAVSDAARRTRSYYEEALDAARLELERRTTL